MKSNPRDYRVDAAEKVAGQTCYIRDELIPGLWYGTTVRSPHPRARIVGIRFDPQFDWDGVVTATAADVANNYVAMLENDMPFLAADLVNYVGEPVLVIAAPSAELAEQARRHVEVVYQPLPALLNMLEAENSEIRLYGDDNIFKDILIEKGDLRRAEAEADAVVEMEIRTGLQEHLYLEPQGVVAWAEGDRIIIRGSLQCPYYVKGALETMFAGEKRITVMQAPTGGAFGGKEDYPSLIAGHAALLAAKCGHPVAFFFDRQEDVIYTTKRHPSYHHDVAYVRGDGRLLGLDLQIVLDGGAYCTLSQVVLARAALTATGCYYVPHVRVRAKAVATNMAPAGAFRGFGGPQAIFAIEMLMEKIARTLDLPPEEVRRQNLIEAGRETSTGQILRYSVSAVETFEDVLARSDYRRKKREYREHNIAILRRLRAGQFPGEHPGEMLKGIGICAFLHGAGFTGTGENRIQGRVRVALTEDGKVKIYAASTEMGQGEKTVFGKILSETLGIHPEQIVLADVNTDLVPDSGPTVASRTTMIVGSLLVEAGREIVAQIGRRLREDEHCDFEYRTGYYYGGERIIPFAQAARKYAGLSVERQYLHPPLIRFSETDWRGDAYPVFSWAASVAELEVDPLTFETRVTRYITTHEIGRAINYDQAEAQIQGGSLQGIGYALYERTQLEKGRPDITGFSDYIIPTTMEKPEFAVKILENPYPFGPLGAKGLGELPFVGAAPAVVSALWMIFESEFNSIPVLPEDLYRKVKLYVGDN